MSFAIIASVALSWAFSERAWLRAEAGKGVQVKCPLINAGLEEFPGEELVGWKVANEIVYPGKVEMVEEKTLKPHSGKYCLAITAGPKKTADGALRVMVSNAANIPAKNGDSFAVRIWARSNSDCTVGVNLTQYTDSKRWVGGVWPVFKKRLTAEWQELDGTATIKGANSETGQPAEVDHIVFAVDVIGEPGADQVIVDVDDAEIEHR
ncbi:MAG: hypothetical protein HY360_20725 [Verrucomicrobia bacterium]|nr:hypothetical protein [Verrucomicrobiota bacterium]